MKLLLFCQVINEHKYLFDLVTSIDELLKKLSRFDNISVFCEKFMIF